MQNELLADVRGAEAQADLHGEPASSSAGLDLAASTKQAKCA